MSRNRRISQTIEKKAPEIYSKKSQRKILYECVKGVRKHTKKWCGRREMEETRAHA